MHRRREGQDSATNRRLAHPKRKDKRNARQRRRGRHGRDGGALVAGAHELGDLGGELPDVVQVLADALLNLAGGVGALAGEASVEGGAEALLQGGGDDADADAGAEGAEEVRAGDDDGGVFEGGVGEEADEGCCDA